MQKRAIRILHWAAYRDHTFPLFRGYKVLRFVDFVLLENSIFVNKCFNEEAFSLVSNHFRLTASSHSYCTPSVSNGLHCMKKVIFVLRKFAKRTEKIIFSSAFVCFRFTEISYFLSFSSNENVRKQHLSANAYYCVNMKFLYTIAGRKD